VVKKIKIRIHTAVKIEGRRYRVQRFRVGG
jgi:hypothetical protein